MLSYVTDTPCCVLGGANTIFCNYICSDTILNGKLVIKLEKTNLFFFSNINSAAVHPFGLLIDYVQKENSTKHVKLN